MEINLMISYEGNFAILIFLLFCHSHLQPTGVRSEVETNSAMANEVINQFPCTNQGCEATHCGLELWVGEKTCASYLD